MNLRKDLRHDLKKLRKSCKATAQFLDLLLKADVYAFEEDTRGLTRVGVALPCTSLARMGATLAVYEPPKDRPQ